MLQMLANVQKIWNERFLKMIFRGGRAQSFVPAALRPPHLLAPRPRSPSVCARGESVFAPYLPMTKPLLIVCHGTVAHLPRRGGTSATPPRHVCRGGVANEILPCEHENVPFRNGHSAYGLDDNSLKQNKATPRLRCMPSTYCFPVNISHRNTAARCAKRNMGQCREALSEPLTRLGVGSAARRAADVCPGG